MTRLSELELQAKTNGKGKWNKEKNRDVCFITSCMLTFVTVSMYCLRLSETLLGRLTICETLLIKIMAKNLMVSD